MAVVRALLVQGARRRLLSTMGTETSVWEGSCVVFVDTSAAHADA